MIGYHPPGFRLLEARAADADDEKVRWLFGWNGLVTQPATDVTLAVKTPTARALVTTGQWTAPEEGRQRAAANLLALKPSAEAAPLNENGPNELARSAWKEGRLNVDDVAVAVHSETFGQFNLAVGSYQGRAFAAAWSGRIALRSIAAGEEYVIDPCRPQSHDKLNRMTPPVFD